MVEVNEFALVWLKRDLRLRDHKPLFDAVQMGIPIVVAYIVEPENLNDPHMGVRHWRFIYQSVQDLNQQLTKMGQGHLQVLLLEGKVIDIFNALYIAGMRHLLSHQEIGLKHTFTRDQEVTKWCGINKVNWQESVYGAVKRPLANRYSWRKHWKQRIEQVTYDPDLTNVTTITNSLLPAKFICQAPQGWKQRPESFQLGGEQRAWYTLKHFLHERGKDYFGNIGKPMQARKTCSRLSPYLAWGNISIKQVFNYVQPHKKRAGWKRSLDAFCARLAWHCHFIQKFESEHHMEHRCVNKAYAHFPYVEASIAKARLNAWQQARTGVPIIDASMEALKQTGYLNFRMRAMLVSFLCHHLNVDWRLGVECLGSLFLDFEPGIHYPQFQMQAGVTGTNTIRIYNPLKQSIDKDPDGEFIRKWLPALAHLPKEFIHQPELLPPIDACLLDFNIERDYYLPIIDVTAAAKEARDRLWAFRKRDDVRAEAQRVLHSHSVLN
jgi:deoxyribodipyrimidine photo-lyase